jgi:uncharacterized protein YndB with AHSA1/START domain
MSVAVSDRIEKKILLRAPRARVWRAIADSSQFGQWFGVKFDGPFVPGAATRGTLVGTVVDEDVAKMQRQYAHVPFEIVVDRVEPEQLFSFRWHPYGIEPGVDYSQEPTTLIEFRLEEAADGVLLTVTESGFDRIPVERRAKAFAANGQGWAVQVTLLERYLGRDV